MTCRSILEFDAGGRPFLSEREIHHLLRVRRLGEGEVFLGLDRRQAAWYECRLQARDGRWHVDVVSRLGTLAESPLEITLGAALIKKSRFEWLLQKVCELGVSEIVPLRTRYVDEKLLQGAAKLRPRWEKILQESVKQCGRSRVPRLGPVTDLKDLVESDPQALPVMLDPVAADDASQIFSPEEAAIRRPVVLLVGPEGGWGEEERRWLLDREARGVFLGPRTLRAETAALAAVSVLQYLGGDFKLGAGS
jgi:16S rRNA (uracil1498-N3)-methyltransferase